jgi:hypothetical protein
MGTRTNDLTEFAKPVADELAAPLWLSKQTFPIWIPAHDHRELRELL